MEAEKPKRIRINTGKKWFRTPLGKQEETRETPTTNRNSDQGTIMNQENQAEYIQVSSFPQDELDEQTSTSDLPNTTKTKPFKPIEQAYLKAFIKITRQRTKADHYYIVLNEALRNKCPPKGLTPNIRHNMQNSHLLT